MDTKTIIETAEEKLIHTYNRYQIVLDKGDGVRLYDKDGKEYLDFGAGIAVFALGYNNKEYNDAVKAQVDKLIHTSNYFYNEPAVKAAQAVTKASGMDRVFFTNSGTEAVEGAIKLAKKYAYLKDGSTDHEIIAMEHSFHGRSMGALAVTGNRHYQEAFGPMIPGIKFAKYNDLESVKSLVNDKTCAIIFETVQGEGGVYPAKKEFIEGVRKLCDEKGILLILDEIGRGTSTFDGLSIAWAVVEHIANTKLLGAKTLFATHYHELTELEGTLDGVNNYCIAVKEKGDDIVFLRKIIKGGADKSYGIQVAKLAGVPDKVVSKAKTYLRQFEAEAASPKAKKPEKDDQISLVDAGTDEVGRILRSTDINSLTPLEALNLLSELQQKARG